MTVGAPNRFNKHNLSELSMEILSVMKVGFLSLVLVAALGGCSKSPEEPTKSQDKAAASPPPAPSMAYEQLIVTDDAVGNGVFTVANLEFGSGINYLSRMGVINVLESVVQAPDATVYVKIEKAYRFGEKYVLIVSTGENGASCPATTYAFTFDTKTESVTGKAGIDGCSENVESLSDGNKLIVKKEGVSRTFYNGEVKSAPESQPATVQASPAVDPLQEPTRASLEFTADEKSAYCTSFGLTFATAVKAKHDRVSFDPLYESPRAMAKFVVKDGNAAKKARIETMLTNLTRNIQNGPEEDFAPLVTAMAEHGFDYVMQSMALGCKQDGLAP